MSILARFSSPASADTTTEQYDEVVRRLQEQEGGFPPDGLEFHCAFRVDGGVRVSEIWDSRAQFEAFGQRLMPLLAEAGITVDPPEVFEVYNIVKR
jgi:hypothetical protein